MGYDNEESRDKAVYYLNQTTFNQTRIYVEPYFCQLCNGEQLIASKLEKPNKDINTIRKCNNYWNQSIYSQVIIDEALKYGIHQIAVTAGRFNIFYYHQSINPFIIHLASAKRKKEHIICVRPQTRHEIAMMLQKCDFKMLKKVLTKTNQYNVDWRYYKLWN